MNLKSIYYQDRSFQKKLRYYVTWVSQLYAFCKKDYKPQISSAEISRFLKLLSKNREHWQVQQASEAIHTYQFYIRRNKLCNEPQNAEPDELWKTVADDMMRMMRLRHLSLRTEKTYLGWLRAFYKFLKGKSPKDLDQTDVKDFLTHLAVDRKVSSATQNQAFNAILFCWIISTV